MTYHVYILSSFNCKAIYIGVTNNLKKRVSQHKLGRVAGFTQKYCVNRLVYFEEYSQVIDSIAREKQLKGWTRKKNEALINTFNPSWEDLSAT